MTLVLDAGGAFRALGEVERSGRVSDELLPPPLTRSQTAAVTHAVPAV